MERVDANLIPFAKNNPSGYRFAFGTDTATDDINANYNDNIKKGWGTTPNEFPEVEDFNAMAYTASYLTAYLYQMGISEWNNKQNYRQYSRVMGRDGLIYKAKTGTDLAPNANKNPTTDSENWEEEQKLDVVDNIEDLATYSGTGLVMVKDINRGGTFVSKTAIEIDLNTGSLYTVNGGTVFAKLGGGFWVRQYSGDVNVKWFGVKGDGVYNDSDVFQAVINDFDCFVPNSTYILGEINIPANRKITTDNLVVVKQLSGAIGDRRTFNIVGSNVSIGDMTIIGNISTDSGEQRHGIFVRASSTTGNLTNINIGNIRGVDIRGDVIYIGQTAGYKVTNVSIGDVVVDNVFRNGVSIVSGDNVSIKSVTGDKIGFCHVDIEPNVGSGTATNIKIGYVKGRNLFIVPPTSVDYADSITIDMIDLSTSHATQSTPPYSPGVSIDDGLVLRNAKRIKIGHLKVSNFNRCGIFITYNSGELGCEDLIIDTVYIRNCSLTDTTYSSYINVPALTSNSLKIGYLNIEILQSSKRGFDGLRNAIIDMVVANIQSSSVLLRNCQNVKIGNINQTGSNGFLMVNSSNNKICGGVFTGDRLASDSTNCMFENLTATASVFLFTSGKENHTILNSTLNGVYYSLGTGARDYINCLKFGSYSLWVSSTGKLYIKNGVPTSDTDGSIVGTQS